MKILVLMSLLIGFSACGIKGDPLPPAEQQTIQTAQDLNPAPAANPQKAETTPSPKKKK